MVEQRIHWGEIPESAKTSPDITADIDYAMNQFFLDDFEEEECLIPKTENIRVQTLNPIMSYGIALHKYKNQMYDLIATKHIKREDEDSKSDIPLIPAEPNLKLPKNESFLNCTSIEATSFTNGEEIEVPELSSEVVNQILKKSVATIFVHIGYETSEESSVSVMVDVLTDFLNAICSKYKVACDDREKRNYDGFPHAIERVLTEIGMDGMKGLDDFYRSRVIKYSKVLEKRCKNLTVRYNTMSSSPPVSPVAEENPTIIKTEKEEFSEKENPEVHFPVMEGDVNLSIPEPCYQLLNSLEAAENLQNLVETLESLEEETAAEPIQVQTEESAINAAIVNKKARYK